jgi:hypothetical protein
VFAGGSYEEVARWLLGFLNSHAKRESPRVEGIVEAGEERAAKAFGVRLRLGQDYEPPLAEPAIEFSFEEVAAGKGSWSWCQAMSQRVSGWARRLLQAEAAATSGSWATRRPDRS